MSRKIKKDIVLMLVEVILCIFIRYLANISTSEMNPVMVVLLFILKIIVTGVITFIFYQVLIRNNNYSLEEDK